ncbi:GGDEF domain-containing protein [Hydrogenophaga soli]
MNAQVWVQALTLGASLCAMGWMVAAGPLHVFARPSRDFVVFNGLVAVASLVWWPLPVLNAFPPTYRLTLGLVVLLAGMQWLCLGLHKLHDFKATYAVSPFMLPFLGLVMAAVAWVDGSGQSILMAACGACLWMLGVTVQQGFPSIAASAGVSAARWALMPVGMAGFAWIGGMVWAGLRVTLLSGGAGQGGAADILGVPFALVWLVTWALINGTLLGLVMLKLIDKIRDLSTEDDLTGAMNMRTFINLLNAERERLRRHPQMQTLVVCQIDQYDALNRQLGFAAGDAALRHVTGVIGRNLRKTDRLASSLQGELLLFLPSTPAVGATLVAERTQATVKANPMLWRGQAINLTLSMGLASWDDGSVTVDALVESASQAALRARREGGARIRLASSESAALPSRFQPSGGTPLTADRPVA